MVLNSPQNATIVDGQGTVKINDDDPMPTFRQRRHESFVLNLHSPTNATFSDSQGVGTITDDD